MMKQRIFTYIGSFFIFLAFVSPAFAHVVVKPSQVGVGAFQTFSMGVPSEKDMPTVALRLVIPEGLKSVSPNVKPGWTITEKKSGNGEDAMVTEISWTGGSIPSGQRDDFYFSAQVPASPTTLKWKAYQTYQDGTVVAWDHDPQAGSDDKDAAPPYSQTSVVNDLTSSATTQTDATDSIARELSIVAIALSAVAIVLFLRRKK